MELRARLLLVEDEPDIRRFARMALESEGHEVFEADTLQRGLIEAGSQRPELAIIDLGLPATATASTSSAICAPGRRPR